MGRYDENINEVAARTMALFYLFDKSGSMMGTKIGQVNYAMKDIPKIIKEVADSAPNANIVVAAATFSTDVNWITPKPLTPDEFIKQWHDIQAEGLTSLGAVLKSLNEKMSRKAFLGDNPMGYLAPGIIILSDGAPTDDWEKPLEELKKNNYGWVDWTAQDGDGGNLTSKEQAWSIFTSSINENIEVILFHDYNNITLSILPDAIEYLQNNGYIILPLFYESNMVNK